MEIVPLTDETLQRAAHMLLQGKTVVHPTETCYGIAGLMTQQSSIEKVFRIKQRPFDKPVSALFPDVDTALTWVSLLPAAAALLAQLPGPLTVILPVSRDHVLYPTPTGGKYVGVRVSSHPAATQLARLCALPLSTTSANVHGEANPYDPSAIAERFSSESWQPDLILDAGVLPVRPPSRVVDATGDDLREVRSA